MFTEQFYKKSEEILKEYPRRSNGLLPILHLIQEENGHISDAAVVEASKICKVPVNHVRGVLTFYGMFHKEPVGKCHIQVCKNLSCWLQGSDQVIEKIKGILDIHEGETTADGVFSLEEVECLGACGYGPTITINDKYYEKVNLDEIEGLMNKSRKEALSK